jgi:hypothetical protein
VADDALKTANLASSNFHEEYELAHWEPQLQHAASVQNYGHDEQQHAREEDNAAAGE